MIDPAKENRAIRRYPDGGLNESVVLRHPNNIEAQKPGKKIGKAGNFQTNKLQNTRSNPPNDGGKALRILHCPTAVGGHPQDLCRLERLAGLESRSVVFGDPPFGYQADEIVPRGGWNFWSSEWRRWTLLREALRDFDVIHFNFGSTLMPHPDRMLFRQPNVVKRGLKWIYNAYASLFELRDLPILKKAGKVIAVTWQGDDARQWDYCREHFRFTHATEMEPVYLRKAQDNGVRKRIAAFSRYADIIYALNPDLMHVLPERTQFFPYAHPNLNEWQFCGIEANSTRPLRVVHAPSNPLVKGTRFIEEAVATLRSEGIAFEYIKVEGMPNAEARRVYETADILIDQLLAGWYGGLSGELMALGKPVICYIRQEDLRFLPATMADDLPIINADPLTITSVLRGVLSMPRTELEQIGRRSRAFMERWHQPEEICRRVKADYESAMRRAKAVSA